MEIVLLGSLIAGLAALAQAVTGFGFALVLVPLLALIVDPKLVVVISVSLGLVSKAPIILQDWRHVELRKIAPLCVAAIVGSLAGVQILLSANPYVLKVVIGVAVIALSLPLLFEMRRPARRERLATALVGLTSGVLNGATSMGGPPVVLFGVNQAWGKQSFRANLCAYFVVTNVSTLLMYAATRTLTAEALRLDLLLVPAVIVGFLVGNRLFPLVPVDRFRKGVVLLVIATGLLSATTGLRALGIV